MGNPRLARNHDLTTECVRSLLEQAFERRPHNAIFHYATQPRQHDVTVAVRTRPAKDITMDTMTFSSPDYAAIKAKQQAMWESGDYAVIGTTLQIVGERLVDAIQLEAGERVLDVAAGNGNASLAAARHFAVVTSTDYVGSLLDRGRERAEAERLAISFEQADVEALPYRDGAFDVVLSTFGVMFAPHQEQSAREMLRILRKGGRIGMANWTPEGFIGQLFKTIGRHVPPPAGVMSPALWGTVERLTELFPGHEMRTERRIFNFRYKSADHWLHIFKSFYGPTHRAFASLDPVRQMALETDIRVLLNLANRSGGNTLMIPSEYLEIVVTKI